MRLKILFNNIICKSIILLMLFILIFENFVLPVKPTNAATTIQSANWGGYSFYIQPESGSPLIYSAEAVIHYATVLMPPPDQIVKKHIAVTAW